MLDWGAIYATNFVSFKDCHLSCDGYCCKNFFGQQFSILSKQSVMLPLLEQEFQYYQSQGGIVGIQSIKKEQFILKNQKSLVVYFLACQCQGLCSPHCLRPLICRIYPYFPIVSSQGEILDFYPASLMDLFFSSPKAHPCTLVRQHDKEVKNQLKASLSPLLDEPLLIFAFRLLELLAKSLQAKLQSAHLDTLSTHERASFFRQLEWSLLSRNAWKSEGFKQSVVECYDEIASVFGDFL